MTDREFLKLYNSRTSSEFLIMGRGASYDLLPEWRNANLEQFNNCFRIGINQASIPTDYFNPSVHANVSADGASFIQGAMNFIKWDMIKSEDKRDWFVIPETFQWFYQYSLTTAVALALFMGARTLILAGIDRNSKYSSKFDGKDIPEKQKCFNDMYDDLSNVCWDFGIRIKHIKEII